MLINTDSQEIQGFEEGQSNSEVTEGNQENGVTKELPVTPEVTTRNQQVTTPELPATRRTVAGYFDMTHQNLTKSWIKPLQSKGYKLFDEDGKKISEQGFGTLKDLIAKQKESNLTPREVIEELPSIAELATTAIATYQPKTELAVPKFEYPELVTAEIVPFSQEELSVLKKPTINEQLRALREQAEADAAKAVKGANEVQEKVRTAKADLQGVLEARQVEEEANNLKGQGATELDLIRQLLGKL